MNGPDEVGRGRGGDRDGDVDVDVDGGRGGSGNGGEGGWWFAVNALIVLFYRYRAMARSNRVPLLSSSRALSLSHILSLFLVVPKLDGGGRGGWWAMDDGRWTVDER